MLCSICKEKPATVHLTQIVGDKMQKLDLCEDCAKTKGVNDPTGFSPGGRGLLLGLGASQEIEQAGGGVELKCPRCGFTQADFKKSGRLGCPECYQTFAEGLEGLLKTMHKGTRHAGKVPEALRATRDLSDRLKTAAEETGQGHRGRKFRAGRPLRDEIKQITPRGTGLSVTVTNGTSTNFSFPPPRRARRHGPHDRIVMSSRVRLARNLRDAAFPGWAKKPERVRVLEMIRPAVESLPEMKDAFSEAMDNLSTLDKQILVERHLISREHAAKSAGSGLVFNREETLLRDDQRGGSSADAGAAPRAATAAGVERD